MRDRRKRNPESHFPTKKKWLLRGPLRGPFFAREFCFSRRCDFRSQTKRTEQPPLAENRETTRALAILMYLRQRPETPPQSARKQKR